MFFCEKNKTRTEDHQDGLDLTKIRPKTEVPSQFGYFRQYFGKFRKFFPSSGGISTISARKRPSSGGIHQGPDKILHFVRISQDSEDFPEVFPGNSEFSEFESEFESEFAESEFFRNPDFRKTIFFAKSTRSQNLFCGNSELEPEFYGYARKFCILSGLRFFWPFFVPFSPKYYDRVQNYLGIKKFWFRQQN